MAPYTTERGAFYSDLMSRMYWPIVRNTGLSASLNSARLQWACFFVEQGASVLPSLVHEHTLNTAVAWFRNNRGRSGQETVSWAKVLTLIGTSYRGERSQDGITPLMCAALLKYTDLLYILLRTGPWNLATDLQGHNVLHYAACSTQKDREYAHLACKYLVDYGIDPNSPDNDGLSSAMLAYASNSKDCFDYLNAHIRPFRDAVTEGPIIGYSEQLQPQPTGFISPDGRSVAAEQLDFVFCGHLISQYCEETRYELRRTPDPSSIKELDAIIDEAKLWAAEMRAKHDWPEAE